MEARYIFGGDTGMTPEQVRRQREWAQRIMAGQATPQNWGEGVGAIMKGFASRLTNNTADKAETTARSQSDSLRSDVFSKLVSGITGGKNDGSQYVGPTSPPATGGGAAMAPSGGDSDDAFLSSLIGTESGGNWQASNDEVGSGGAKGHFGRLQFGKARLEDAMNAGVLPRGTTPQQFMANPELQQQVEAWHFSDIDRQAQRMGLDRYIGQNVGGAPITQEAIRAMAHLGGIGGAQKFLESGGRYNPEDAYGTSLLDYATTHGGTGGQQRTRVASADPGFSRGVPAGTTSPDPGINAALPSLAPPRNAQPQAPQIQQPRPQQAQAPQAQPSPPMPRQIAPQGQPQMPGGGQAPVQTAQAGGLAGIPLEYAFELLNDAWSEENQALGQTILNAHLERQDPAYQQQMQINALRTQQLQQQIEAGNFQAQPMAPEEMAAWGIPPDSGSWTMGPDRSPVQLYEAPTPSGPDYGWQTMPDGTLVRTDSTGGEIAPMGNFAAPPDQAGFDTVTLQLPDGSQRTFNTAMPDQAEAANAAIQQGATEVRGSGQTINVGGNNDIGTIPPGMMVQRDQQGNVTGMVPIPGGPAEAEAAAAAQAANSANQSNMTSTDVVLNASRSARGLVDGMGNTGTVGRVLSNLTETDAAELRRQVGVLTSVATIENLNAMREQSPTGGALGNVTEGEGRMLAAASGAIDPNSSPEQLKTQIDNYEATLLRIIHGYEDGNALFEQSRAQGGAPSGDRQPGQSQANPEILSTPAAGTIMEGYRFLGGDPSDSKNWEQVQ